VEEIGELLAVDFDSILVKNVLGYLLASLDFGLSRSVERRGHSGSKQTAIIERESTSSNSNHCSNRLFEHRDFQWPYRGLQGL